MNRILSKAKDQPISNIQAKYERIGLLDNPFPLNPFVNKSNADNRYNGSIYETRIRENEFNQIITNFIKVPQSNPNHIRMGYIQDNSYVGRGNGKSAFALNLVNMINSEFSLDLSDEVNKCFGLHILPETSGRTKTFDSFVDLIFQAILDQNLISYSLASLRLEAISNMYPEFDIKSEFDSETDLIEKLNNEKWFNSKTFPIAEITKKIYEKSDLSRLGAEFPLYSDLNKFYTHRVTTQEEFKKYYFNEIKKGKSKIDFIFNDLILLFRASGFNGGYLIVDDFERIPDFQSEKLKQEFALELRTNFFDGVVENAKTGFLNLILVMHAGVQRLVEKAWSITGMERRSPLITGAADQPHVIKFDKLDLEHSKMLIKKYLDEYRIAGSQKAGIEPFNEKAIAIISEKCELNAASILEKCYALIEELVKQKKEIIDEEFVNDFFGKNVHDVDHESEDVSGEESTNLFEKAKKKS